MSVRMFGDDSEVMSKECSINGSTLTSANLVPQKYDLEKCVEWIEKCDLKKICLQFPDHLLPVSTSIALYLKTCLKDREIYILCDTAYGSCCIDDVASKHVDSDGIIHFGHACLSPTSRLPIFHVFMKNDLNTESFCGNFEEFFKDTEEPFMIFYDIAYAHAIESIYNKLKKKVKNLVISKLNCKSNIEFADSENIENSVILGRHYNLENGFKTQDYNAIFIGPNGKTLAGMTMSIPAKDWYHYDAQTEKFQKFSSLSSPWLKRRRYLIEKLKDSKVVAIVVATLGISDYLKSISSVKQILKEVNKKSYILSVGKINCAKLSNFPEMDAFVVISCPESEVFDSREFPKPVLMPYEVEVAFNSSRPFATHHCTDFRQILPGAANYCEFKKSSEPDVSLITGEIRTYSENTELSNDMKALMCKSTDTTVAIGKAGASFLLERSWKGLEQRLGKDDVATVEKGRSGVAAGYDHELNT